MKSEETTPSPSTTIDEREIRTILAEAMGYASMCWEPRPSGLFDSSLCETGLNEAMDKIKSHLGVTLTTDSESQEDAEKFGQCPTCKGAVKVYDNGLSYEPLELSEMQIIEVFENRIAELCEDIAEMHTRNEDLEAKLKLATDALENIAEKKPSGNYASDSAKYTLAKLKGDK